VTTVAFAGGGTTVLMWVLSFFAPEFFMSAPAGAEAAVTTILVGLIAYFLPAFGTKRQE
jgi:hypothetical protein